MSLALIIAAANSYDIRPFLDLTRQAHATGDALEVIVVEGRHCPPFPEIRGVRFVRVQDDATIFRLWGAGILQSTADHVAMLDGCCPPSAGWLAAVRAELKVGAEVIYGPVEPAFDWRDRRAIGYLAEYVQFHRPLPPEMTEVPGNNLVVARRFTGDRTELSTRGFVKTLAMLRFENAPRPAHGALVMYDKPFRFSTYLRLRFHQGRAYATHRRVRGLARALRSMTILAVPVIRLWRIQRHSRRHREAWEAYRRWLPLLILTESAWSLGEGFGYLSRPARRFDGQ